jgi:hypothetical protein
MSRRAWVGTAGLLGTLVACGGGTTSPHQPAPCPAYRGGEASGDSLYGVYRLVSYCIDTLPGHGPPADSGHVTLQRTTSGDSVSAVFATQGQPPIDVAGTYTLSSVDSIHLSGQVTIPLGSVPAQLSGTYVLRHDTLAVSGLLTVTGSSPRSLSFVGARK